MLKAHQFKKAKPVYSKTMMFHGKSKMCECGQWSWMWIHDPKNWAKKHIA